MKNPFPGPQPYRAADRARFFGRVDTAHKLEGSILANQCVTVYGPSGAGKSSLLQAAVFPKLVEKDEVRLVRVDAWPEGEEPTKWLASALQMELGQHAAAPEIAAKNAIFHAVRSAARSSPRLLVVYLDQLEQLLFSNRTIEETQPFFDCVEELLDLPLRNLRVVLSLREDYLGRFRDRLRDLRRITENGFRVGPLNVYELTEAVVLAAAAGEPPQSWATNEMRGLMMQVRVPGQAATDEAEAQSAYAQIICRALFQERAAGKTVDVTEAEPILQNYLASTVSELGALGEKAQRLLEEHLVGADGSRTLRTEKELSRVIEPSELGLVLKQLEGAAILRAEEHHGSRYFEIGHDWLARRVFEQRVERERLAEQKRIEEAQARQLAQARAQQRKLRMIAAGAVVIAALVGAAAVVALIARSQAIAAQKEAEIARKAAEEAEKKAAWERDEANDLRVMAGYLALQNKGDPSGAMILLSEVKKPDERSGWVEYANAALEKNALFVTLSGHREALRTAAFSQDGKRVLTTSDDHTARIWNADGKGQPIVLEAHEGAITYAAFAPNSNDDTLRVLTTSADGSARVWTIHGSQVESVVMKGQTTDATYGAWSPDGQRVVVASTMIPPIDPKRPLVKPVETTFVRVHSASDGAILGEFTGHKARVNAVVFLDDTHIMTASDDKTVRIWDGAMPGRIMQVPGHTAPVSFVEVNREKGLVVTASWDTKARVFKIGANAVLTPLMTLDGHSREVLHATISDDGKFVATASADRTARVWNIEQPFQKGKEVVFDKHDGAVNFVAFRRGDANFIATASSDQQGRIFRVDIPDKPFVLTGHAAPLRSIGWSPAGDRLVTAAWDASASASADHSAKIWRSDVADATTRQRSSHNGPNSIGTLHAASFAGAKDLFAAAYDGSTVELRSANGTMQSVSIKAAAPELWGFISAVAPNPEGTKVAFASLGQDALEGTLFAMQNPGAKAVRALYVYDKANPEKPIYRRELTSAARHVAWDEKGDRIALALEDMTAMVLRTDTDAAPTVFKGHKNWLTSALFSPDGQKILTTSIDRTALVFDVNGNGSSASRFEHPAEVYAATFDSTGKRIATACADGKIRIFPVEGGNALAELDTKGVMVHRVAWSRDGTRIAAALASGAIVVWSAIKLPLEREPRSFVLKTDAPALALSFVDGNNRLVAITAARTYAWGLDIAQLKAELQGNDKDCLSVDNRTIYLNEAPEMAAKGFEACELGYGRIRPSEPAKPVGATDLVATRIVVWPGDAEIEMSGVLVPRRNGLLELWAKPAEKKKLRVVEGADSMNMEVTFDSSGVKPSVIDLDVVRSSRKGREKPTKAGEGDFDALTPEDFQ